MKNLLTGRIKILEYVLREMFLLIKMEYVVIRQFSISTAFIVLGFYFAVIIIPFLLLLHSFTTLIYL